MKGKKKRSAAFPADAGKEAPGAAGAGRFAGMDAK